VSRLATIAVPFALLVGPALGADNAEKLPDIGPAPAFSLMSQDGEPISLADLRGKVVAVTFIYTQCPDICPLLTQKMVEVQDALGGDFDSKIHFVSITLDPEHDTPAVLKDYAQFWGAKPEGWSFLTGAPDAVREIARHYGVYFSKTAEGGVDHTQLTSVIDGKGEIRVQYLGARFNADEFRRDLEGLVARK
jgi:protein SCO1/2